MREGRGRRGRERISSRLPKGSAEPYRGLDPTALRSGPEPKSRVGRLTD